MTAMRINRYISASGYSSRRQADQLIEAGKVTMNGELAVLGAQVKAGDVVQVEGQTLHLPEEEDLVYIAFNKPPGIVCTANPAVPDNIIDYLNFPQRIFTVGRLDRDSRGLILLTNDGSIVNPLIHARNQQPKEYKVKVNADITDEFLDKMRSGVAILDTVTLPAKLRPINKREFFIEIKQGLNRQIRRMCEALGYEVIDLQRIRIMDITLEGLAEGSWRHLKPEELEAIKALEDGA
ncbi:MAG: pseudouridine synthase [Eubacteriales bacterium]|nr:pseudouridine synthase [Eubacteriales bacterium]MDD4324418.1 pseudouridine synthase [Eubacteriales bacterium]